MTRIWPVRWEPERRSLSHGMAPCWCWESLLESKSLRRASCWFDYQGRFELLTLLVLGQEKAEIVLRFRLFLKGWRRPTLAESMRLLPSARLCLTAEFGMGPRSNFPICNLSSGNRKRQVHVLVL